MNRRLTYLFALSCGLAVANLYYHQPLLGELARAFGIGPRELGIVSMLAQMGYALGMLLIVPLGDLLERKALIVTMLIAVSLTLIAQALAQGWLWLAMSSFAIGFATISPQLMIPFAAHLARPEERGRIVGTLMSGLLLGILLSRTLSGWVSALLGWRAMYWIASAAMAILAGLLARSLPRSAPTFTGSYRALMASLLDLARRQPLLRQSALIGALLFASFSAFWTVLALFLETPPYHYASGVAGLFGLVGAAGALSASAAGHWADKGEASRLIRGGAGIILLSFAVFYLLGHHIWGLVLGVILLDLGLQGAHVANLSRVYSLEPEAKSRINTVYMVAYFLGGAAGSMLGAFAWEHWGWGGVCALGSLSSTLALLACRTGTPVSRRLPA